MTPGNGKEKLMATRTLIEIDEDKCDGCGLCASGCHEGAIRVIDGKARLIGENLCDGLGACVGECPQGALTVVTREAEAYDERRVIDTILPKGMATVLAHLEHLHNHGQDSWYAEATAYLSEIGISVPNIAIKNHINVPAQDSCGCQQPQANNAQKLTANHDTGKPLGSGTFSTNAPSPSGRMTAGCPGSAARFFASAATPQSQAPSSGSRSQGNAEAIHQPRPTSLASRLQQWPIQLHLINPRAPYFQGCDLLIAADCTAFACGAFHQSLLEGRRLVIACPKLDQGKDLYLEKLRGLIDDSMVVSIVVAIMDVPCCSGLKRLVEEAASTSNREVPISTVVVGMEGGSLTWL